MTLLPQINVLSVNARFSRFYLAAQNARLIAPPVELLCSLLSFLSSLLFDIFRSIVVLARHNCCFTGTKLVKLRARFSVMNVITLLKHA